MDTVKNNKFWFALGSMAIISIGMFVFMYRRIDSLTSELASTANLLNGTTKDLSSLREQTSGLSQSLTNTKADIDNNLSAVKNQVGGVEQSLGSINGKVSTLQKLTTTDQELLRKYSKVYFLNENYSPAHLSLLPQDVVYSNTQQEYFLTESQPFLQSMISAAQTTNGITLYVSSAYRSFAKQKTIKSKYTVTYGAGTASAFSADQGYSEHQLGTTVDLTTKGVNGTLQESFDKTDAYKWLTENAYKFGFEMSYPKGNAYYVYEPWHWRFVGVKLATYLHDQKKNFYDLDQREIDSYLATLFD
jgi:LAS superfamily LD-carboxypeptidase LdcB